MTGKKYETPYQNHFNKQNPPTLLKKLKEKNKQYPFWAFENFQHSRDVFIESLTNTHLCSLITKSTSVGLNHQLSRITQFKTLFNN